MAGGMGGADRVDLIEVACFHCGKLFEVCIRDYRGQRYCKKDCRELGYRSRGREAGRRYQGTPEGRERHRRRQWALRERGGVTHGATGEVPAARDTVSPDASETRPSANEEVPDESTRDGKPGLSDRRRTSDGQAGQAPRLRRCIVCGRAGVVVFRFARGQPEGIRV